MVSKAMAFKIKSLFGENENLNHLAGKDRARILTKRVDRQKDADLNSHQHRSDGCNTLYPPSARNLDEFYDCGSSRSIRLIVDTRRRGLSDP